MKIKTIWNLQPMMELAKQKGGTKVGMGPTDIDIQSCIHPKTKINT